VSAEVDDLGNLFVGLSLGAVAAAPAAPAVAAEAPVVLPPGTVRCAGVSQWTHKRCRRTSAHSYPQSRSILATGYCTDHLDQHGQA